MEEKREELVKLASGEGANRSLLARRFGVSRKTLYKWLRRCGSAGQEDVCWARDRSRRPQSSPGRVSAEVEETVLSVRRAQPAWGARTILDILCKQGWRREDLPAPSTVCRILERCDQVACEESLKRRALQRFEHEAPNDLWQMDFKGPFQTRRGECHPLTVVDDHSRYAVAVEALADEKAPTTRHRLTEVFRCYGLPHRLVVDNGSCWGRKEGFYSSFSIWLVRLGIGLIFCRPRHPQTRGKNERFHRTLKAEAIAGRQFRDLYHCQRAFDDFRHTYNTFRPHQALAMAVPASRYRVSERAFPERLPAIEYLDCDIVCRVRASGVIVLEEARYQLGRSLRGEPVALRPTRTDGVYNVFYCHQKIAVIDRRKKTCLPAGSGARPPAVEMPS